MNRQPSWRSVLHTLLSTLIGDALPQRPPAGDRVAWIAYWQAQNQPWRTEPEIDTKRQNFLARRRAIVPDIEKGIYPFRGMKLSRADVEWLLATHENRRGPVKWEDETQRGREGLDLRGADLNHTDLRNLPLSCLRGGLNKKDWGETTVEQSSMAGVCLEGADLRQAHLEGSILRRAHLEHASLRWAYLDHADLHLAYLEHARCYGAHLEQASLKAAHLEYADLERTYLMGADLSKAHLEGANLDKAHLKAHLGEGKVDPADLRGAFFDGATSLNEVILGDQASHFPLLADVHWNDVNLALVKWAAVHMLGDEFNARQRKTGNAKMRNKIKRLGEHEEAVRANRQLATALQAQGLNEDAARFAYRAQILQRTTFRLQMLRPKVKLRQRLQSLGKWLFSGFLYLIAGYGYRLGRSFFTYLLVIGTFMALYLRLDPHLVWYEALVVSMTAFHGRGFSPSTFTPGDPLSIASAVEAFVGLLIEVTLIATLTRRFFGQ
jgi:uncharacterized protein YjbI with pentapeptide repeats